VNLHRVTCRPCTTLRKVSRSGVGSPLTEATHFKGHKLTFKAKYESGSSQFSMKR